MTIEQCEKFIKYYEELGEANWRSEDGYFIDACRTVLTQQAQVAMLREALDRVLHEFVRSDVTMEGEYWALRCLPQAKVATTAKDARAALAANPADVQAWLEKQRKLAAAEALEKWADAESVLPGDPPPSIAAYFCDQDSAVRCLRAAVVGTLNSAKKQAAQLRKEAGE